MFNKLIIAVIALTALFLSSDAVYGVDVSLQTCQGMSLADWQCLVKNGYSFAIIEVWNGGYQYNNRISQCVSDAWNAGMRHVDVYAFMCPQCSGNNPPASAVSRIVNNLAAQNVTYGMLWFDIEQCDGCWYADLSSNGNWIAQAVKQSVKLGVNTGIYSSVYEWGITVGTNAVLFPQLPLWYAHYDNNPSFSDSWAYQYGGWTSPAIKQFNDKGPCANVDVNWYP